jgi:hypothetical protein
MKTKFALAILCWSAFFVVTFAQNISKNPPKDTSIVIETPVLMKNSVLFSPQQIGFQIGLGKVLFQKEKHFFRKSGEEIIHTKNRTLYGNLGYYYQPGLHHHWFLTAEYQFSRVRKNGFFADFTPLLGVSRTFLTEATYSVDVNNNVTKNSLAGNWYLTSGFSMGLGKTFIHNELGGLKTIFGKLTVQTFYPNFNFIALKPYFQIGTIWELNSHKTHTIKKIRVKNHLDSKD